MNKRLKKIVLGILIVYILMMLGTTKVFARTIDTNIDAIDDNLYPRN
ncbi:MAG: hypothetical protein IJ867_00540 [Clostridia bacterium]|nr:hypothetical protein [Clostridia bacterium]